MKTFPNPKIENLINRICFGMGSTPARFALRCSLIATVLLTSLSIICSARFATIISNLSINSLLSYSLWFFVSLTLMIFVRSVRDWVCGGKLERYFALLGVILIFHTVSNQIALPFPPGINRIIFIIALSWAMCTEFYTYCHQAIGWEKAVLEQGKLPLAQPAWLAGLCLFSTIMALLLALSVWRWWEHWFLITNLAVLGIAWAVLAVGCLAAACTPRPPTHARSLGTRIGGLFGHAQPV